MFELNTNIDSAALPARRSGHLFISYRVIHTSSSFAANVSFYNVYIIIMQLVYIIIMQLVASKYVYNLIFYYVLLDVHEEIRPVIF